MKQRLYYIFVGGIVLAWLATCNIGIVTETALRFGPEPVYAAQPVKTRSGAIGTSQNGGVTISPAFQQVSIRPDQPSVSFDFLVTNNSDVEYEFGLSVVDFGSLDETGGVLFVGNAEKALSYRYALSPWVTLEKDRVVVAPHATEKIPITLNNKESLAPGGHYGAVLVTPTDIW